MAIVEIDKLCFSYSGKEVLHNVDLTVEKGDFISIIGPNGGGKTTLLKLLLGLLKPTRGSVLIHGRPPAASGANIGYVPQQINHNLSFPATALDVVLMGANEPGRRLFQRRTKQQRLAGGEALAQMGIGQYANRKITDLSGGQRQRVLIARALVNKPELLVLDEPTASIDTKGQNDFYQLLKELNESQTILMVSHDLLTIANYVKSIACVNKRLHYHRNLSSPSELLEAFYTCSLDEFCQTEAITRGFPETVQKEAGNG